jgi:hypothetical protein
VPPPAAEPAPSPLDWLAARSLLDAPSALDAPAPTSSLPEVPRTAHHPMVPPPVRVDDRGAYRVAVPDEQPATAPGAAREKRLADILAENAVSPSSGGRRRRRYRDEDDADDVLARVLGQS